MSKNSNKYITVFVPTYNGEQYLHELIESVLTQVLPKEYELEFLITDSGSKDNTLTILEEYKDRVTYDQIPNSDFGHGKTRQRAAKKAKGEFMVYLSQDATPSHNRWLINLIEPFFLSDRIGCVFGRQRPRPNAAATIKREVSGVFDTMGAWDSFIISRGKSLVDGQQENPDNVFFSDVNSAVRRELLLGEIPFRDLVYSEDQALANDMQTHGYLKAYSPKGEVIHSNEYTPKEYYHRKFDEYLGLQNSVNYLPVKSLKSLLLGWIRPTVADWKFIRRDGEYSLHSKVVWAIESPFYNFGSKAGQYMAALHANDTDKQRKLSLESKRKQQ